MNDKLNYSVRQDGELKTLELAGSLNSVTKDDFVQISESFLHEESLIVNLENIRYITSSGIHALLTVNYYARENGKKIIFLYPTVNLKELINYSDNYGHLIFAESAEECKTKLEYYD